MADVCGQFAKKIQQNITHLMVKQLSEVKAGMTSVVIFPDRAGILLKDRNNFITQVKFPELSHFNLHSILLIFINRSEIATFIFLMN